MSRGGKSGTNKRSGSFGGNRGSGGRNRGASSSTSGKSKSKTSASLSSGRSKGNSASSSSIGRGKNTSTSSASKNRQSGSTNRGRGKETPTNTGRNKVDTTAREKRKVDKQKQPSKSSVNKSTQNNRKSNETTSRREDTRNRSWFGRNRHRDYDYGYYDEPGGYYRPVRRRRFFSNRYSDPYYHRDQHHHHHHHHGDQYHEGSQYREGSERRDYRDDRRPPRPQRQRMGCSRNVGIVILVLIGLAAVSMIFSAITDSGKITSSTVEREPLPSGAVDETDYFTDTIGWIDNQTVMLRGLQHFYSETGVQPHVYITEDIDGDIEPSMDDIESFSNALYDELFTDEAHLLLVFFEPVPGEYAKHYVVGTQAQSVIDTEATDILLDYLEYYYEQDNLTDAEFFSLAFQDAANRIMEVTTSPWVNIVTAIVVIALLVVGFLWWKRRQEQKKREAERLEKMLAADIDTFGQYEAEDLSSKYQDQEPESDQEPEQEENKANQPS
ncbi:hypothetical protein [Amphibacillus jilinensis]|uniref:hypothetical protein n=1 Tax=Amphibacillus jilinensis TaxID=1216008 RepID=UPI0003775B53|nr:hypothetical protein [Amphibacillus jilinensis]